MPSVEFETNTSDQSSIVMVYVVLIKFPAQYFSAYKVATLIKVPIYVSSAECVTLKCVFTSAVVKISVDAAELTVNLAIK